MTSSLEMKDAAQIGIGTGGLTFPWWGEVVAVAIGANSFLLGIGATAIVLLTVYNLYLKNVKLRQDIKSKNDSEK
jgi:hypothetical protein